MTPAFPVGPQLEPLVAALEHELQLPRTTHRFSVSTQELTRVAQVFITACRETLDVRLRFDTPALCSSWPEGRAQKDGTWHLDAFINTFLLPPPVAKWFDGATQLEPADDAEAAAQEQALSEVPPVGLAFSMDEAQTQALLPEPAATAMNDLSEETVLAVLAQFDLTLEQHPTHALVLTLAAGIASSLPTLHRAAAYSRRALAVSPSLDARYRLADILSCIGEPDSLAEAIALFRSVLDEQSEMHRARLKLARSLYESGDEPGAIVEIERLVRKGWGEEAEEAKRVLEQLGITLEPAAE